MLKGNLPKNEYKIIGSIDKISMPVFHGKDQRFFHMKTNIGFSGTSGSNIEADGFRYNWPLFQMIRQIITIAENYPSRPSDVTAVD